MKIKLLSAAVLALSANALLSHTALAASASIGLNNTCANGVLSTAITLPAGASCSVEETATINGASTIETFEIAASTTRSLSLQPGDVASVRFALQCVSETGDGFSGGTGRNTRNGCHPENAAPATETPLVDTPVVDTPVVEAPVVETPVVDTPVIEAPADEAPVVEAPANEPELSLFFEVAQSGVMTVLERFEREVDRRTSSARSASSLESGLDRAESRAQRNFDRLLSRFDDLSDVEVELLTVQFEADVEAVLENARASFEQPEPAAPSRSSTNRSSATVNITANSDGITIRESTQGNAEITNLDVSNGSQRIRRARGN